MAALPRMLCSAALALLLWGRCCHSLSLPSASRRWKEGRMDAPFTPALPVGFCCREKGITLVRSWCECEGVNASGGNTSAPSTKRVLVPDCSLSVWGLQCDLTSGCLGEGVQPIKRCFSAAFPCRLCKLELINRLQFDSCHGKRLGGFATLDVRVPSAPCVGACLCTDLVSRSKAGSRSFPLFLPESCCCPWSW